MKFKESNLDEVYSPSLLSVDPANLRRKLLPAILSTSFIGTAAAGAQVPDAISNIEQYSDQSVGVTPEINLPEVAPLPEISVIGNPNVYSAESIVVTHTVAPGDSLNAIADLYRIDANQLGWDGDPRTLPVGHTFQINLDSPYFIEASSMAEAAQLSGTPEAVVRSNNPVESNLYLIPRNASVVDIMPGQTLAQIASEHNVGSRIVAAANGLADPDLIFAGEKLAVLAESKHLVAAADAIVQPPQVSEIAPAPAIAVVETTPTLPEPEAQLLTTEEIQERAAIAGVKYIPIPEGVTVGEIADLALYHYAEVYADYAGNKDGLVADILAASNISDPNTIPAGTLIAIGSIADEQVQLLTQVINLRAQENLAAQAAASEQARLEAEAQAIAEAAAAQAIADAPNIALNQASFYLEMLTPPNMNPVNSEGYSAFPLSIDGTYVIGENTPESERCLSPENIIAAYTVAVEWRKLYPNNPVRFDDANAPADQHRTHNFGKALDVKTVGEIAADVNGSAEASFELAKLWARTGMVKEILYHGVKARALFNAWAEENGLEIRMNDYPNHKHHMHVKFLDETGGIESRACAEDTIFETSPPNLEPIVGRIVVESDSTTESNDMDTLLDLIAAHESGGNYNAYYGNGNNTSLELTNMTVAEVLDWQDSYVSQGSPSSAAGKYQIVRNTLRGLVGDMNIDLNAKFDAALQDRFAIKLLERRGLNEYLAGQISAERFAANLAMEWAALPKVLGSNPDNSYYQGDGLNRSSVGVDEILAAVGAVGN